MPERKLGEVFLVSYIGHIICIADSDELGCKSCIGCELMDPHIAGECMAFMRSDKTNVHFEKWNGKPNNGYPVK